MERHDRSLEIRSVHEHVVCADHVESVILDCGKLGARIHMEVCCGIGRSRNRDHPFGEVNTSDESATFRELDRQISRTATSIEDLEPLNVARKTPQDWVRIQPAVRVSVSANLGLPVVSHSVPELSSILDLSAHRAHSPA